MQKNAYLEKAVGFLHSVGINLQKPDDAPVLALLERVQDIDPERITHIATVLQQSGSFNEMVRREIEGMEVANRYEVVTGHFNSIRTDLNAMVGWMDDGKLDFGEKVQKKWMELRRGSITDRFNDIRTIYLQVCKDTNDQIQREHRVIEAYKDFRLALKHAGVDAQHCLKQAESLLGASKAALSAANDAAVSAPESPEKSQLELVRDEAVRHHDDVDRKYQIVKDIADNLKVSYNTSEVVFARIDQISKVKERIYQQSTTFFSTNETVFTALATAFESSSGLAESTNTLNAMKAGVNDSLETLAGLGNSQLTNSLKAGYGATISAPSVKLLADAISDFQASSVNLIKELREEATNNANELEAAVNESKDRFAKLVAGV